MIHLSVFVPFVFPKHSRKPISHPTWGSEWRAPTFRLRVVDHFRPSASHRACFVVGSGRRREQATQGLRASNVKVGSLGELAVGRWRRGGGGHVAVYNMAFFGSNRRCLSSQDVVNTVDGSENPKANHRLSNGISTTDISTGGRISEPSTVWQPSWEIPV